MGTHLRWVLLLAAAMALGACASQPTPYQPRQEDNRYGYIQEQIDASTWRIDFFGNRSTSPQTVERYVLYRAAELALANGAEGFVVLNQGLDESTSYLGTTTYTGAPIGFRRYHGYSFVRYGDPFVGGSVGYTMLNPVSTYQGFALVRLFSGEAPQGIGTPFDAANVKKTLAPRVETPSDVAPKG